MKDGGVFQSCGDFELDGVTFPAAEVKAGFLDPPLMTRGGRKAIAMFPAGRKTRSPGRCQISASIDGADQRGRPPCRRGWSALAGTEPADQHQLNGRKELLALAEAVRAPWRACHGRAGGDGAERNGRHAHHLSSRSVFKPLDVLRLRPDGESCDQVRVDQVCSRTSSRWDRCTNTMTGTGAVAIAAAAALPGTLGATA